MKKLPISVTAILVPIFFFVPLTSHAYTDVADHDYATAIDHITTEGIVQGYSDDTYRPDNAINRAEFTKILIEAILGESSAESANPDEDCFSDVQSHFWYAPYVCYAKENGILSGYPDGTFGPGNNINLAEASKILVNVFAIPTEEPEGDDWYSATMEALERENYIPLSFYYFSEEVTRGEMAEMIWRILEEKHDRPSRALADLTEEPCQPLGDNFPDNINIQEVWDTWLTWTNDARTARGFTHYTYNDQLHRSAFAWSETAEDRGYIDHKRDGQTAYYDYWKIQDWFEDLGLTFQNDGGYTFTENIGWGPVSCTDGVDCTQDILDAMRYNFDYYMNEAGQDYSPHYDSIMNSRFTQIGFGLSYDEDSDKMYMTIHYGTEITSNPAPICAVD